MPCLPEIQIDLRQMILALETAVDLVGMNDTHHGKRVGYIAGQIAFQLGLGERSIQFAFELGLLHDCGVSTEQMHSNLVNHFDWEDSHLHCEIGHRLLRDFEPLARFALPILHHHTHWQDLARLPITAEDARMANLIFLADRVDILAASHYGKDILLARKEIVQTIRSHSATLFDPVIVEAFSKVERSESFWISLEDRHITRYAWDMGKYANRKPLSLDQLKQLSLIMAHIVDQKSPFTAQHSLRVGLLARHLAEIRGLLAEQCQKIEIAAYLHDIGKLRMPDAILEKTGPLNATERAIMKQHSYETHEILRHIDGLEDMARWAAFHHEGLNGTGYPFHPLTKDLSIEARIIAVADIFQALVQDRPYRHGLGLGQTITLLQKFSDDGRLDPQIVALAASCAETCYHIATGMQNGTT